MDIKALRNDKTAAYVGPFLVFMLFKGGSDAIKSKVAGAPWYLSDPEHWVYPIQTLVCLALIWWWKKHYQFGPSKPVGLILGAVIGIIGLLLWLLPGWIFLHYGNLGLPAWASKALGIVTRYGDGFNPDVFSQGSAAYISSLGFRFLRMSIAVPILEELFWRGFLWNYLQTDYTPNWWKIPFANPHWKAFAGTLLLWPLAHGVSDFLGCVIYAALISFVAVRTRSLLACIICHGVTNLLLGIYTLKTGQWNYW